MLTVSVSVAAGVAALYSAFPELTSLAVPLIAAFIGMIMVVNLRGLRESGTLFAAPTYVFIGMMLVLIGIGVARALLGDLPHVTGVTPATGIPTEGLGLFLLAKAFADGCSAMTGTEAVANGVPAFKPVEWKNAQQTMMIVAILLTVMFLGTSFLAIHVAAIPTGARGNGETVLSQVGRTVFGGAEPALLLPPVLRRWRILILAANTSFADFPRLSSILARDGFFPRQFALRGERLAFNSGIVALAIVSIVLVVAFNGSTDRLDRPLRDRRLHVVHSVPVGMVRHWYVERGEGWRRSAAINGVGAVVTGIVASSSQSRSSPRAPGSS